MQNHTSRNAVEPLPYAPVQDISPPYHRFSRRGGEACKCDKRSDMAKPINNVRSLLARGRLVSQRAVFYRMLGPLFLQLKQ